MKRTSIDFLTMLLALAALGGQSAAETVPIPRPKPKQTAAATTTPAARKTPVATPVITRCAPAKFRLAIDIGHTPKIPGSISARGVGEYEFNLRLAKEVYSALRKAGFSRTFLINPGGREIKLGHRIRAARRKKADLFLSVHHDSVRRAQLKKWTFKGEELEYSNVARGHSVHVSKRGPELEKSLAAARLLGNALRQQGLTPTDHHARRNVGANLKHIDRYAGVYNHPNLAVLWLSRMPSVLFEGAVIKNPTDETRANNPGYRQKLVSAIVSMAEGYCGKAKPIF